MVPKRFGAVTFFKENASLFTVFNVFLFISLYVFSVVNSPTITLSDYSERWGNGLIYLAGIMAFLILIFISIQLWDGRKEEISIFSWLNNRIIIKHGDPLRFFLYIIFILIVSSYITFIQNSDNPLFSVITTIFILAIPAIIVLVFETILFVSKINLEKIRIELVEIKQQRVVYSNDWRTIEECKNVPLEIYELLLNNLREYRKKMLHLEDMYRRNRYYRYTYPLSDKKVLNDEFLHCDLYTGLVLDAILTKYLNRLAFIYALMGEKRDYRVVWDHHLEIEEVDKKIGHYVSEVKPLFLELADEYPELIGDLETLINHYSNLHTDIEKFRKDTAVNKVFHCEP